MTLEANSVEPKNWGDRADELTGPAALLFTWAILAVRIPGTDG